MCIINRLRLDTFILCILKIYNKFVFCVKKIYTMCNIMTDLNELLKQTSRSLYLSARLLPLAVRDTFSVAYLLCRYADSIADTSLLAPDKRLKWIEIFPSLVLRPEPGKQQQLLREISGSSPNIYEEKLLQNLPACQAAFQDLPPAHRQMILDVVAFVCEGMKMDLHAFPPENAREVRAFASAEQLYTYCRLMGGEPGVFWSRLIASHVSLPAEKELFFSWGRNIGEALQIVNILRDLPRDLRIGRCYFPEEDLQKYHLHPKDLLEQSNSVRFEPVKQKWIAWGRDKLHSAFSYFSALPKGQLRHRAAVAWPVLWAADTLNKLEREQNLLDPGHKVKIPRSRIYATILLTPPLWGSNAAFNTWLKHKFPSAPPGDGAQNA